MTNGLARYYTPLCFLGVDALVDGRDRSHSLFEDVRGASCCPDSYYIRLHPPLGSEKVEWRRRVDKIDSLERERKLEEWWRSGRDKYLSYNI